MIVDGIRKASRMHPTMVAQNSYRSRLPILHAVVFAHNEAAQIDECIRWHRQMFHSDHFHVIADHCIDNTAFIAKLEGAAVYVRIQGERGKGRALKWWIEQHGGNLRDQDWLLVLDADSRLSGKISPDRLQNLNANTAALQLNVLPSFETHEPLTGMLGLSEILEQSVYDSLRSKLAWPVRLRGTGMIFKVKALRPLSRKLKTNVEDSELSVLLVSNGYKIVPEHRISVLDPKPPSRWSAIQQRKRWFDGQIHLLRTHPTHILKIVFSNPGGLSMLGSIFAKPRSLILPAKLMIAIVLLLSGAATGTMMATAAGAVLIGWITIELSMMLFMAWRLGFVPSWRALPWLLLQIFTMWTASAGSIFNLDSSWPSARAGQPPMRNVRSAK